MSRIHRPGEPFIGDFGPGVPTAVAQAIVKGAHDRHRARTKAYYAAKHRRLDYLDAIVKVLLLIAMIAFIGILGYHFIDTLPK